MIYAAVPGFRAGVAAAKPSALRVWRLTRQLPAYEKLVLVLLIMAAWSPYGAPTSAALKDPSLYTNIWSYRPLAQLNLFELGVVAALAVYALRLRRERFESSALDAHVLIFAVLLALLQLIALQRNAPMLAFERVDAERVALFVVTYGLLSRCRLRPPEIKLFVFTLAAAVLLRAGTLILEHGVLGSTQFATSAGRTALLITEDVTLVGLGVLLLWGLMVDELVGTRAAIAIVAVACAFMFVDFLSLRRGALIFLGLCVLVRTFRAPRHVIVRTLAVLVVTLAVVVPLADAASVYRQAAYAVRSTFLTTSDKSTQQRSGEIENFRRNTAGLGDLLFGHGLGAAWNTFTSLPDDNAAFGSKETAFVRLGWHVYGLDWLYKLGILGGGLTLLLVLHGGVSARRVVRPQRNEALRSFVYSLGPITLVFLLFVFTNTRLAVFAGIGCALVSKILDVYLADSSRASA